MSDKPPKCPKCGGAVSQLMSAPAIQFKGSGFYATDYARQSSSPAPTNGKSKHAEKSDSGSDVKISGSKVDKKD
jgi:predicted nucleic acid-binding Zn ribbon protein